MIANDFHVTSLKFGISLDYRSSLNLLILNPTQYY
jgi:hypothetical protein